MAAQGTFVCHCGKAYSRQENLTRHQAVHAGTKRFACPASSCNRAFTRSDLLAKHIKAVHPNAVVQFSEDGFAGQQTPTSVQTFQTLGERETAISPSDDQTAPKRARLSQQDDPFAFVNGLMPVFNTGNEQHSNSISPSAITGQASQTSGQLLQQPFVAQGLLQSGSLPIVSPQVPSAALPALSNMASTLAPSVTSTNQMDNFGFQFDQDMLVWSALGMNNSSSDLISGGNDIPWILDYTWLNQDITLQQPPLAGTSVANVPLASSSNATAPALQQVAQNRLPTEGLDSGLLSSMLQDIQTRGEGDYDSWKNKFASVATPFQAMARSRAVTPVEGEQTEEDRWPMNWQPAGQAYSLNSNTTAIVSLELSQVDESLRKWEKYWIDQDTYEKVKNSFALAKAMPGPDVNKLRLPQSLPVVNTLISLYFENFYPQYPLIHLPTFEPSKAPPLLLASLTCIGACYSDLPGARELALDLIEVIRKTLNALFEHDARNLRMISLIHVYLLVVIAGLFIGNKRTYELAEASRGTLINLCRRAELLDSLGSSRELDASADLKTRWKQWISFESRKRLGTAICLLDTVFPALLDIPAYHSHRDMFNLAMPCDDQFWSAASAHSWSNLLGLSSMPPSPFFTSCVVPLLLPHFSPDKEKEEYTPMQYLNDQSSLILCSSLHHHLYEFRTHLSFYLAGGHTAPLLSAANYKRETGSGFAGRREWLREALNTWSTHYLAQRSQPRKDAGDLLMHLGHISLYVYVGGLYDAIGKRGHRAAKGAQDDLRVWANHADASHAVDHALSIVALLPGMERSIYYPLCGFVAILVIWSYCKYATEHLAGTDMRSDARLLKFLFRDEDTLRQSPKASAALGRGAELLAKGKAWRIGAALALLLAKQMEEENAA